MANANHVNILGKNQEVRFWFLLLIVFFITARFIFPTTDPAAFKETDVSWHDEGWVHNARNLVLFGKWHLDNFNPIFISPVFTFLEFISFKLFGVNTFSARFVSMLLGSLSIIILYLFVKNNYDRNSAIISLIFFGTNYYYLMFNRVAMLETTMIFFMVLSLWLFQKGSAAGICYVLSACSLSLAYFTKASASFLIVTFAIFGIVKVFIAGSNSRPVAIKGYLLFFGGLVFAFSLWYILWLIPHKEEYIRYNLQLYLARNLMFSPRDILVQLAVLPAANNFFIKMPIDSILSLAGIFTVLFSFILRRDIKDFDILLLLWIFIGGLQILMTGVFARRLLFLIPPMSILASRIFKYSFSGILREAINYKWHIFLMPVYFYLTYAFCMAIVCLSPLEHNRILLSLFLSVPLFFVLLRNRFALLDLVRWVENKKVLYSLVTLSFLIGASQFGIWAADRSYSVVNASREIGNILPDETKVQGNLALALSLENKIVPFLIAEGYGNFADMLEREDIRYILTSDEPFLGSENKAMQTLVEAYPHSVIVERFDLHKAAGESVSVVLLEKER